MAKDPPNTITTVRDSKSGRFVTVKGAGALKGKMTISKKVDLTKPISVPAPNGKWTPKRGSLSGKTSHSSSADRNAAKR
jgi:hypothetical protein